MLAVFAALVMLVAPSAAADPTGYAVADGHYFEQGGSDGGGFTVVDDEAAPLWGEFRRLGGVGALGYPISRRYECDGAVCQAFQQAVFKWSHGAKEVELLSVFDWLHLAGQDDWLEQQWGVPRWQPPAEASEQERGKKEEVDSAALLEVNPALKAAYGRLGPAAPRVYGLARAYRESETHALLRTQRAVLVQPREAPERVEWLSAGGVFRAAGLVPAEALEPLETPEPRAVAPPTRIKVPELGIDAEVITLEMGDDRLLPIPDNERVVAWYSYGARLGGDGNSVLSGHVDWNRKPGVFWRLREAKPGQTITLSGGAGQVYEYRVEWAREYSAESPEALEELRPDTNANVITLVTCGGRFDFATHSYESRRIVRAALSGRRN